MTRLILTSLRGGATQSLGRVLALMLAGAFLLACGHSTDPGTPGPLREGMKTVSVLGKQMAYVETGEGDPIVFLHGNPTSSYLWRNVMPHLEGRGRLIAPDLIGMGASEKLAPMAGGEGDDGRYRYVAHRRYLAAFLEALGVERNVWLVIHDWGSVLGFEWARTHESQMRGIAYMEAIIRPMSFDAMPGPSAVVFRALRSRLGGPMVLGSNVFVERLLPQLVLRGLTEEEHAVYRAPYLEADEGRRPTLTWPRELPFGGEPAETHNVVSANAEWLQRTELPKLLIRAEPGALIQGETLEFARTFPNQTERSVAGLHFIQEDSPDEIGQAVAEWMDASR